MIKVLKIQKGLWIIILGVITIVAYSIMVVRDHDSSQYVLGFAGFLFILGSLMLLYPILTAKKDKDGIVELDKEKAEALAATEETNESIKTPTATAKNKAEII